MNIKRIKYTLLFFVVLFLVFRLSIMIFRLPSYTIQTSGKLYIVSKLSRVVQVFDLYNGEEIAEIPIDMLSNEAINTKDKNSIVLTNYESQNGSIVKIINTRTNKIEKTIELKDTIKAKGIVTFSEINNVGIIDYVNNNLLVLNIENDSLEKQIQTKQKTSDLLALHPSKSIAYVTNMKSSSRSVIDLNKNEVVKIIPCELTTESIDLTPDGSEIWLTNKNENSITIIDTSTHKVIDILPTGNEPLKLKFSIDGRYCLVANAKDGSISVYQQDSKKQIKTITIRGKNKLLERILYHTPRPVNILMHPNGLFAFVSNSNAHEIEVIDMKALTIVSTIGTGKVPDALVFIE